MFRKSAGRCGARTRCRACVGAAVLLSASASAALTSLGAQGTVGFRSGFTEGLGIPPRGALDLDYGSSVTAAGETRVYAVGELTAHIPVARRVGVRLHLNSYAWISSPVTQVTGREDLGVGVAVDLAQASGWRPTMGIITRLDAPSGNLPNRSHEWRPLGKLILGWQLPAGLTLASNIGVAMPGDTGARFVQTFGSAWLSRSIAKRVSSFSELVVHSSELRQGNATYVMRGGITLLATSAHHLDVHASTQLGAARPRRTFGVGIKERF